MALKTPALPGLIYSRTRHRVAAAAGTPRPTADYRFGRRLPPIVHKRSTPAFRATTPPAEAQPRLPHTTTPPGTAPGPPAPLTPPEPLAPTIPRPTLSTTFSPPAPTPPSLPLPEPVVEPDDDPYFLACIEYYTYKD